MEKSARNGSISDRRFVRRVLIVIALGALTASVWILSDILLLIFGAVLVAVLLRAIADPLARYSGMSGPWALALAVLLVVGFFTICGFAFGPELARQMRTVIDRLPAAFATLATELEIGSFMDLLQGSGAASSLGTMLARIFTWSTAVLGALASMALVITGGVYLAADPTAYRLGLVKLVPPSVHPEINATLDDVGDALRLWLGAQLIAMAMVGALTGLGLWMAGVPSPFALGLIVGLADFVPYIGPIFAAVPVILMASTQDWQTTLWALAILVVVQQIEANLIMPLVTGRMAYMAPVVGLFAIVAMGVLFGTLGLLLGFPLAVAFDVAVRRLYVLDTLGEDVEILGEPAETSQSKENSIRPNT